MSRYSKEHYEDVAEVLVKRTDYLNTFTRVVLKKLCNDFADLFAADNPPFTHCWSCGSNRNVVTDCVRPNEEHRYGGFDREKFLAACGLEPQNE